MRTANPYMNSQGIMLSLQMNLSKNTVSALQFNFAHLPVDAGIHTVDSCLEKIASFLSSKDEKTRFLSVFGAPALLRAFSSQVFHLSEEFRFVAYHKSPIWLLVTCVLFQDSASSDIIARFLFQDIHFRRTGEEIAQVLALRRHELVAVIELVQGTILVYSSESDMNLAWDTSYDFVIQNILRQHCISDEYQYVKKCYSLSQIKAELKNAASYEFTHHFLETGGVLKKKQLCFTYLDDACTRLLCTCTDITESEQQSTLADTRLQNALHQAKEAENVKNDFLLRMNHDLRTPMNGIMGFAELGLRESTDSAAQEYFHKIKLTGSYMSDIIENILQYTKLEYGLVPLRPSICQMHAFLSEVELLIRPLAQAKDIALTLSMSDSVREFYRFDKSCLKQILLNLLTNAVKYTEGGGNITCELNSVVKDREHTKLTLVVSDTGIGMTESFMERLFAPFEQEFRHSAPSEGAGLGLSIVGKLLKLLDGEITVTSQIDCGSTFTVELPVENVADEYYPAYNALHDKKYTDALKSRIVLVAEDHPLNRMIIEHLLLKEEMLPEFAVNGKEAFDMFVKSEPSHYDIVLMDILMPVMNGLECARAIRSLDRPDAKNIPIVALSANSRPEDFKSSIASGMNVHLCKPLTPHLLYQTFMALLM